MPKLPEALARYGGMAVQMGITIGLGAWGGRFLDARWGLTFPMCTLLGLFLGLTLAFLGVMSRLKE